MSTPNNTQLGNKSVQEKRRNSGHCPALQRGAMTETLTRITITPSDMLMFAAVAMLPFDGTKLAFHSPIGRQSPLVVHPVHNHQLAILRDTARRFLPFFLFPLLPVLTSVYGWQSYGIHASATAQSFIPYC
ncbi:hypothetical protein BLI011_00005 [Bifidobacterium longum subsp. infantis]|nr:hypothetical protein [Bifidobacterium longum]QSZ17877.1 hypothetical protein BLI011_00005 [Bifidobacterium longum subsp. infantis]